MTEHISLTVNGAQRELDVEPRRLLVQALREDLDLTGTHVGCDTSQCGACTVHVDGRAVKSCTMLAVQADGASVTTIEGMAPAGGAPPAPDRVLGEARPPVRLLHAGHDHGRRGPARHATRTRRTKRSGTRSKATSAAAPATRTSSPRSARPRPRSVVTPASRSHRRRGDDTMADRTRRRRTGRGSASSESRTRSSSPARAATSTTSSCRDGPPGHPAQPVRAREHPLDRHDRGREGDARRARPSSRARTSRTTRLPMAWPAGGASGIQNNVNTPRVLATDSVKWTGEGVAAVIAETPEQAVRRPRGHRGRLGAAAGRRRCREGRRGRRAAAPRERAEQRRVRVVGRRQGRAPMPRSTPPRSSSGSGSSTSG